MPFALSPSRHWQALLVVLLMHAALLALLARVQVPRGAERVMAVDVLVDAGDRAAGAAPSPSPSPALPRRSLAAGAAGAAAVRHAAPLAAPPVAPTASAPPAAPAPADPLPAAVPAAVAAPASGATPGLAPVAGAGTASAAAVSGTAGATAAVPGATGEAVGLLPPRLRPGTRQPAYPEGSRWNRGEAGRVTLRLRVRADGSVAEAAVLRSSGFPRLDRAARDAALRWRLEPARRGGEAVEGVLDTPLEFRLED